MKRANRIAWANHDIESIETQLHHCNEHLRSISQNLEKLVEAEKSTWIHLAWLMLVLAFAHNFWAWIFCQLRLA
jgi:hypothetical protein